MDIQLAPRIERLPTYVLGRLKQMIYDRRKAGADVIDMNMGNPSDPPPDAVVEKIREAVLDPRNSSLLGEQGRLQPAEGHGRQVRAEVGRQARPQHRGHRHHRQQGRLQPHVPRAAGPRRHRRGRRPRLPDPHHRRRPRRCVHDQRAAGQRPAVPRRHRPGARPDDPAAQAGHPLLPPQPHGHDRRRRLLPQGRRGLQAPPGDGHQRLRLRRNLLRRLQGAQPPHRPGRPGVRLRVHHHEQAVQHGRLADRLLLRQRADARRPRHGQGLLRLRHLPGRADRRHHRDA